MDYKEKVIAILNSKELSQEQKEKLESIFPELAESEDERIRKALIENFKFFGGEHLKTSKWGKDDDLLVTDILAWLEKQGDKTTWSEEDEKMLNDILMCGEHHCYLDAGNIAWLKSIKERCTWKPSDEQMKAIQEAMNIVGVLTITGSKINSLYQDLKKLRGE